MSSIVPALVAGARSQILSAAAAAVEAFLRSRGVQNADGLIEEIGEIVEETIKTAGRLKRRQPPNLGEMLENTAAVAFQNLMGALTERGQPEDTETVEVLAQILRTAIEAATSTGESLNGEDDVRGPLARLAEMAEDLLEADPKKLETRGQRVIERGQRMLARAAQIRARG